MGDLEKKKCTPCTAGTVPIKGKALLELKKQLKEGWNIVDEHHLEK